METNEWKEEFESLYEDILDFPVCCKWDFRCLQDFIQQELTSATIKAKEEVIKQLLSLPRRSNLSGEFLTIQQIKNNAKFLGINLEEPNK